MKEELIYINSQQINYLKVGNGTKNVFCFPGAWGTIWDDFKPQIQGLDKNQFTIIAWDPPGHGFSRPPERSYTYKYYEEDADMAYKLIRRTGLKPFSLLGWSDGGSSCMILAAKYPQVIDNLIIWGSKSHILREEMARIDKLRDLNSWSERAKAPLMKIYGEKLSQLMHNWCDDVQEFQKNGGDICNSLLKNIKCPTLILHGDKDPVLHPTHPKYLLENIDRAKLYRFPQGKHNIHLRYVKELNDVVTKFILNKSAL